MIPREPLTLTMATSKRDSTDDATTRLLESVPQPPVRAQRITVIVSGAGEASGTQSETRFVIDDVTHRRALVGSSPSCDVVVAADRTVSRRHAALEADRSGRLVLADLGSRNGTFVDRRRIKEVYLDHGDTFTIGKTTVRVEIDGAPRDVASSTQASFGRLVGASAPMRRLYAELARLSEVARTDPRHVPILLEGEPGTGKSLIAESLHEDGPHAGSSFVVLDAADQDPQTLDRVLFGEAGLLRQARGSTLYLAEVGRLPLPTQLRLSRWLDAALAASAPNPEHVRLIASTTQDLDHATQDRTFREELLAHLAKARIEVPPLRKRPGDVALLTRYFWLRMGGALNALPAHLVEQLELFHWPGNVRELEGAVARALLAAPLASSVSAALGTQADYLDAVAREPLPLAHGRARVIEEFERRYVRYVLEAHGGHVGKASAAAGIGRRRFQTLRTGK